MLSPFVGFLCSEISFPTAFPCLREIWLVKDFRCAEVKATSYNQKTVTGQA